MKGCEAGLHKRRSVRWEGYDYSEAGAYFVTICTQGRTCLFGDVADDRVQLRPAGRMVEKWWLKLPGKFPHVETDEYVVMPNHFHGIIVLSDPTDTVVRADPCVRPDLVGEGAHAGAPLPRIVQWFKTMTTNEYIQRVRIGDWQPFSRRLWQRNYYDHVIRNDSSLLRIRDYILDNPVQWALDRENPATAKDDVPLRPPAADQPWRI